MGAGSKAKGATFRQGRKAVPARRTASAIAGAPKSKGRTTTAAKAANKPAARPAAPKASPARAASPAPLAGKGRSQRDAAAPWPLADAALNEQLRSFAAGLVGPQALQLALAGALLAGGAAPAPGGAGELDRQLLDFAAGRIAPGCMHRILNEAFGKGEARAGPYLGSHGLWRPPPSREVRRTGLSYRIEPPGRR
jgi:hypothetical protein